VIRRLAGLAPVQQLLVAVSAAVVVGVIAVAVPVLGNAGMLLASVALLGAIGVLTQWLWQSRQSTDWTNTFTESAPRRGADSRISRLVSDLQQATAGDHASTMRLHDTIGSLAAERLRDRRGLALTGAGADDDARAALGPELTAYLSAPPTTHVSAPRLAAFITTLEEL
jgi:hypothetical protein